MAYELGLEGVFPYIAAYEKLRTLTKHEKSFIRPIILFRHYVIGCKVMADGQMDELALNRYLELEKQLLGQRTTRHLNSHSNRNTQVRLE
ncbi:MAG TPA: hypothetical protein VK674_04380 [Candidatus Limnocylindria bacterium]|nr:hypothetical protein [Candidatus Limnocylindria bacterium]